MSILREHNLYGNCKVFSPDGIFMFHGTTKKAEWYLNRNLATVINEDPLHIQLNFTPNGLGNAERAYGSIELENRCVNCGGTEDLTKHHVVPTEYRKQFPLEYKTNNFHDVLMMCEPCHHKYEDEAEKLKLLLAEQYGIYRDKNWMQFISKEERYTIKMSYTLLHKKDIHPNGIAIMTAHIEKFLGYPPTQEDMIRLVEKEQELRNAPTHGKLLVDKLNDIQAFIVMWRHHFLEHNECKYLPAEWDPNIHITVQN